jgi:hypothetical protein
MNNEKLFYALELIASQKLPSELAEDEGEEYNDCWDGPDYRHGYSCMIKIARKALESAKE